MYIIQAIRINTPAKQRVASEADPMSSVSHIASDVINNMTTTIMTTAKLSSGSNICLCESLSFAIADGFTVCRYSDNESSLPPDLRSL